MMLRFISKNALVLALTAVASVALVAGVHQLTQPTILEQQAADKLASLRQVLPPDIDAGALLSQCRLVYSPEGLGRHPVPVYRLQQPGPTLYVAEVIAPDGYSGDIRLLVAIRADATVLGVRTLEHRETPGLGDKIELKRHPWILSFTNQPLTMTQPSHFAVKKDGGQFDQFAGATITPRAVVNAVRRAVVFFVEHPEQYDQAMSCPSESEHD